MIERLPGTKRARYPLNRTGRDQEPRRWCDAAQQRCQREPGEASDEHPSASEPVTEAASEQE